MTRLTGPEGAVVNVTWKDTPTKHLNVGGVTFAYRELGADAGVPLVFLHHLTAVLDDWDPRVIDGLAAKRRVITFDNRGIGASGGSVPHSVDAMARDAVAFIRALGLDQVDLLGFSLGGGVAQVIALEEPSSSGRSSWRAPVRPEVAASTRSPRSPSRRTSGVRSP